MVRVHYLELWQVVVTTSLRMTNRPLSKLNLRVEYLVEIIRELDKESPINYYSIYIIYA